MLDLIGFLTLMTIWWGISLSTLVLTLSPLVKDYLTRIGLPEKWVSYRQKVVYPLLHSKNEDVNAYYPNKYTSSVGFWKGLIFIIGLCLWLISVMVSIKTSGAYLWTASVRISEFFAPNAWWIGLLFTYPALVKVGKFFVVANKYVSEQNNK